MAGKTTLRQYFAEGLTSRGYISLLTNMAATWKRIYILLGGPGLGQSTLLHQIGLELLEQGHHGDLLRSAKEPSAYVGLILSKSGIAVLDAFELSPLPWKAPGIVEHFIDLTGLVDYRLLNQKKQAIIEAQEHLSRLQLILEDELAEMFGEPVRAIDYHPQGVGHTWPVSPVVKLNSGRKSSPWAQAEEALNKIQKSIVTPYFVHGLTPDGWLNLAPQFVADCDQIQLEGEETLEAVHWLLQEMQYLGQVIEIVLHPLYPEKVIGVVFPWRQLALWLGDPGNLAHQGLDQPFSLRLKEILADIQKQRDFIRSLYADAVDFLHVNAVRQRLFEDILADLDA